MQLWPEPCRSFCNLDRSQDRCWNCGDDAAAHGLDFRRATCPGVCNLDRSQDRCWNCGNSVTNHNDVRSVS